MKLTFLEADRPLTKTYKALPQGGFEASSYPSAYEFTSHEVSASSLVTMASAILTAAAKGWCLLKGMVQRPLEKESRAGSTNAVALTWWMVLDTDGANFPTPDDFMQAIGLGDVSYVVQYSASSGFKPGLRCHIYVMLAEPVGPSVLKQFCLWKNLTVPQLASGLNLTRTNVALRYPLDITANQNDKLIYIAPPVLVGLTDPCGGVRVNVAQRTKANWSVPAMPQAETLRVMVQDKIKELRAAAGLPEKKFPNPKMAGGVEYFPNPGEAHVTGTRTERGFVYMNLNGGDSWGYWYPENNPEFLYNFKGEPTYKLAEICPSYWGMLQGQVNTGKANSAGIIYIGACDKRTGLYKKVTFDENTSVLTVEPARNKDQVKDFLKQHGQPVKDIVLDWTFTWDPHNDLRLNIPERIVNSFEPSEFMKRDPVPVTHIPPTIKRVLMNVMGDDPHCLDHFCNWIAFILQKRGRTNTAWLWFGDQGTGKGVSFHEILTPIFGIQNVVAKRMEELESEFTGFMENKLLVFMDEVQVSRSAWYKKITAKLKNLIAEPMISIRRMYTEAYMAPNYSNMIFASNMRDPLEISPDDRRFNIAPFQKNPIKLSNQDFVSISKELFEFYSYLMSYPVDETRARTPYQNEERKNLIETSMLSVDVVSRALHAGDIDFFIDQLPQNDTPLVQRLGLSDQDYKLLAYKQLMKDILSTGRKQLSRDDLHIIFSYCTDDVPKSPNKLTSFLRHHNIRIEVVWNGTKSVRGMTVPWKMDPKKVQEALDSLK